MTNRLADATSPYLLQHAENPVDWWPWSPEAFEEARRRNVPVLLSIGYAACHWCHVMAHESFEDASVASFVNENFVAVKVDREERPDVDAVYMEVTQAMTGHGGWPMTVFLTPDARPFHAGTYYPPTPRPGMPSFTQLIEAVSSTWALRPSEVLESASVVVEEISRNSAPLPPSAVDADVLAGAVVSLLGEYDRRNGGFGGAPKFPPSMVCEFLLRHYERTGAVEAISMATSTADAMANGGMYDQLGGGFARYSVDASWVVPHFEKMLYDNALLLRFYTHLARVTGTERYSRVARDTAAFLLRDLRTAEGGFAASLDADTDGVEGLTYVW
ncbi:MAG TPA: thioredoxin domain-containing protein, partial [Lentzea sp.]